MIKVNNLAKRFKVENPKKLTEQERKDERLQGKFFHSVKDVSFSCEKGQVLALLGPNGAGKTTTLRMLSTALKADQGSIYINQVDVAGEPLLARKKIGFLSGATGLYGRLTGRENIHYFAQLHGMDEPQIEQRLTELADLLDMHDFLDRRAENYSTGMKQKTSIARAVFHQPEVVILDEPTTGLDIMATQTVLDFISHLKELQVPVVFSTHHLNEVSELCDKVVVIDKGQVKFSGDTESFVALGEGHLNNAFLAAIA